MKLTPNKLNTRTVFVNFEEEKFTKIHQIPEVSPFHCKLLEENQK